MLPTASGDNACSDLQSDALKLKGVIRTLWTVIEYICCFRYWRASREEQPKRIMGEAEDGSLVLWSVGMVTQISLCCAGEKGGKEFRESLAWWQAGDTHTHTTGAQLCHIKIQGRSNNRPQLKAAEKKLHSFCLVFTFYYLLLHKCLLLSFHLFTCFVPLLSSSFLSFRVNVATQAAREIRLALCGPDICSRRQASFILRIETERGAEQRGKLGSAQEEGQGKEGKVRTTRRRENGNI